MRKHFLLFMALFALASVNNLFAAGEAEATPDPTGQTIEETALPFTLSDWNATKFASNVWVPTADKELVTWSESDQSFLFAGKDKDAKYDNNNIEHPFVIKLAEAPKQLIIKANKSTTTGEGNTGSGWKVYEWNGTQWNSIHSSGYSDTEQQINLSAATRYILIATTGHGGGNRIFAKFEITSIASMTPDKTALAFQNNTAQTIVISNSKTTELPSVKWKVNTGKFSYSTTQTGNAESGTTTIMVTPESGAVAGDIATLTITAGPKHLEIPVVYYNNSVPLDLTSNGSIYDAARFVGMCSTLTNTTYAAGTKTIEFAKVSSAATTRELIIDVDNAPLSISFTINAAKETSGWGWNQQTIYPKIQVFEKAEGEDNWSSNIVTWENWEGKQSGEFILKQTTRSIKLQFDNITGAGTLTNLKIKDFNPTPVFSMPVDELDWGSVAVGKSIPTADKSDLVGKLTAQGLNYAAETATWTAALSGGNADQFVLSSASPALGACEVSFRPTSAGLKTATLTLTATNSSETCVKTVTLKGTGDAAVVVEISKNKVVPTNKNFGTIIGTNSVAEVYDVFYNGTNALEAKIVNSEQDHTVSPHFSASYDAGTKKVTVTAHKDVAVDAELVASACLAIGESTAQDPVYAYLPLTATYETKNTTGFTWNISGSLVEDYFYKDIYTATTDATITVSVGNNNPYLSYADNKLTTGAITSGPQDAGSIIVSAPATNNYVAINETLNISLTARLKGLPLDLSSSDDWARFQYMICDGSTHASYNTSNGKITMAQNMANNSTHKFLNFKFAGTPDSIKYTATMSKYNNGSTPRLYLRESSNGTDWTSIVTSDDSKSSYFTGTKTIAFPLLSTTRYLQFEYYNGNCEITNLKVTTLEPTVTLANSSVVLKNNKKVVNDATIQFSVLKYAAIKVVVDNATDFGLVKGDAAVANDITFTNADDNLNETTFTNCNFKVRYKGDAANATGKSATIIFYDGENNPIANKQVAVSVIDMPVLTFEKPANGSYTYKYGSESANMVSSADASRELADAPYEVTLIATAASNYKFFAWYEKNGDNKTYLSYEATYTPTITTTKTIGAEFISAATPLFIIKGQPFVYYKDLNSAITAANGSGTIVLVSDGTLPEGEYTIPSGVTLLIPFDEAYSCYTTEPMILHGWRKEDDSGKASSVTDPSTDQSFVYRTLTLASGAQLNIEGTLSLSAKRWCVITSGCQGSNSTPPCGRGAQSGSNRIHKGFGLINMENGSSIQVKSAGKLYCWGRIRGAGSITAKSGSEVRECYVYTDWRNNDYFAHYAQKTRCFPQNQYYIQDIQVPITYESGATGKLIAALFYTSGQDAKKGTMNFVGSPNSNSFFEIPAGATMTKKYEAATDRLIIDLENGASFNNFMLKISSPSFEASTSSHIFTITNNWTVNVNSGTTTVKYDLGWAPGSILNIKQGAAFTMLEGVSMYVYDHDDWGDFAAGCRIIPAKKPSQEAKYGVTVKTRTYNADCPDAEFIINGTLTVTGGQNIVMNSTANNCTFDSSNKGIFQSGLYTTEGGANIHGTGVLIYSNGLGNQTETQQLNLTSDWNQNMESNIVYYNDSYSPRDRFGYGMARPTITAAKLNNGGDYTLTSTANATGATTFKYVASTGKWGKVSTVTFKNGEAVVKQESLAEGEAIVPPAENPTKPGYVFGGWDNTPATTMGTTDLVYNAVWAAQIIDVNPETTEITADSKKTTQDNTNSTFTVSEPIDATEVTVAEGATVEVDASLSITETFVIKASENNSGELKGVDKVEIPSDANVYFDYNFDNTPAMRWNAIAFPWQVDATSGVKVGSKTLVLGKDFDIVYYDGNIRAQQGKVDACWRFVEDDIAANEIVNPNILVPGRLYMILFAASQNVVRFEKVATAPINNTELNVAQYAGSGDNANWNGIANPTLYHAYLETGVEEGQVYNNASDSYSPITFASANLPVGKPVFVQAAQAQSVVISSEQPSSAPMRAMNAAITTRVEVELIANNVATDKVIIRTDEDAVDAYTIGSDLAKAGVSSKVAQMWVNRYGSKLCKNTVAPVDNVAEYPLTFFAPTNGNYLLNVRNMDENMALYLTQNGEAIAELTEFGYSLFLDKGNSNKYGLRLIGKKIPGVVTSLDEAIAQGKGLNKVIYRGNLYIIRDRKVYNAAGQLIK